MPLLIHERAIQSWFSAGLLVLSASEANVVQAAEEMFQTMPLPAGLRDNSGSTASMLRHHLLLADDRPQQATSPDDKLCVPCLPSTPLYWCQTQASEVHVLYAGYQESFSCGSIHLIC